MLMTLVCSLRRSGHQHAGTYRWVTAAIAALIAITGCGIGTAHVIQAGELPQEASPNWINPIGGVHETSLATVQRQLPFKLHVINSLPSPYRILLTPGRPRALRVVVLQYHTQWGLVDEYEEMPQLSPRQFRAAIRYWVGLNGKAGTSGTTTSVKLADGSAALMTTSADGGISDIRWIEAGVEYKIRGPALTQKECLTLANDIQH
jgi:hypothetical protein